MNNTAWIFIHTNGSYLNVNDGMSSLFYEKRDKQSNFQLKTIQIYKYDFHKLNEGSPEQVLLSCNN